MSDETPRSLTDIDTAQLDPAEAARNIAGSSDEQLVELMAGPARSQVLAAVFGRMAEHFRADTARDADAVIQWRIRREPDGGVDEWECLIANGACAVHEGFQSDEARVTFSVEGADFLKLVTGSVAGPTLFMSGRLKVEGDMMFAASAAGLFTIPKG